MAIVIPDFPKDTTASERLLFERLGRELDDEWIVLHSLGLSGHPRKLWGEADFVVLSTKGVFVLEIKGGRVSCEAGRWKFESRDGRESYTKNEGPFEQAKDAMFALRKRLETDPLVRDVLIGYGVVMPFESFTATGSEIEQEVLLDRRDIRRNLGFFIGHLSAHWRRVHAERHGREPRLPAAEDLSRIRRLLRPDIASAFSLGSYLTGLEQDLLDLTNEQIRAVRGMANNPRTLISGRAGTGKTIVAVDRARKLAEAGRSVLYVCFNRLLAKHVRTSLQDEPYGSRVEVRHLHSIYSEWIGRAGLGARLVRDGTADNEYFGRTYPEVFVEAALTVDPSPADVLVVDEMQDLLTLPNLEALDLLLDGGLRRGSWHFFLDPMQNIYGHLGEEAEEWLRDVGFAGYELAENCRNTRPVAVEASIVSGVDLVTDRAIDGPECGPIFFSDVADFHSKLEREVRRILAADVAVDDVVLLSTRRIENSLLAGQGTVAGQRVVDISDLEESGPGLHFCTMHAFKGLERRVVLAIDLEEIGDEEWCMLHYAGLSRAKTLLRTFIPQARKKAYEAQARAFGQRLVGRAA
jgi:hypothetical protein